ncbi:MAG TPA: hypothetical protein VFA12_10165 [Stellaceae bacterium]|nr:hypothetical protein [Stellaceae bacterium]
MSAQNPEPLAVDLLWGGAAIARELGVPTRKAFYLLEHGHLPGRKIGGLWVASRQQLRERLLDDADRAA